MKCPTFVSYIVKNRCASMKCWPLCVLIPDGATCLCPDNAVFTSDSKYICDSRKPIMNVLFYIFFPDI